MTDTCRAAKRIPGGLMLAVLLLLGAVAMLPFDDALSDLLRSIGRKGGKTAALQEALALLRPLGKGDVIVLIALVIGFCGWRRKAVQIFLSLLLVSAMVWPLKLTVGRERPNRANPHSFPSGDTATAVAFCAPFLGASPWALPATLGLGGGVAAGRVFDGRHYPSDVLAGAALGLVAGIAAVRLLRRVSWRPRRSWFLGGLLILGAIEVYHLQTARGMPNVSSFLQVWGPLGCFLAAARLISLLIRRQETSGLLHLNSPRTRRAAILAVFLTAAAVYIFVTNSSTLWDRDEPRFSRATVEMVESGNYLYPTFNGALRPDKPILIYWLMSLPVRLMGPTEWTCRLIAPLATAIAALMVYWLGSRLGGARAGIMAAAFLVTAPLTIVSGTAATTDALLLMWIVAAMCAFAASWLDGFRPRHALLMGLALGGALLTKGPVGAIPLLCVVLALVLMRKRLPFRPVAYLPWLLLAAAIGLCIFLAWALPADAATNGEFFRKGVGHHVVGRSLEPLESHGGKSLLFVFYYLPIMLFAFFPGTLYLPAFFRRPGQSRGDRPNFLFSSGMGRADPDSHEPCGDQAAALCAPHVACPGFDGRPFRFGRHARAAGFCPHRGGAHRTLVLCARRDSPRSCPDSGPMVRSHLRNPYSVRQYGPDIPGHDYCRSAFLPARPARIRRDRVADRDGRRDPDRRRVSFAGSGTGQDRSPACGCHYAKHGILRPRRHLRVRRAYAELLSSARSG